MPCPTRASSKSRKGSGRGSDDTSIDARAKQLASKGDIEGAELLTGYVLFQNDSVAAMLARITSIVGPFPETMLLRGRHAHKYFVDGMVYERDRTGLPYLLRPKATSLAARTHTDDELFLSFVGSLLQIDPDERPTAEQALQHPWLQTDPYGWPPPPTEPVAEQTEGGGEALGV